MPSPLRGHPWAAWRNLLPLLPGLCGRESWLGEIRNWLLEFVGDIDPGLGPASCSETHALLLLKPLPEGGSLGGL